MCTLCMLVSQTVPGLSVGHNMPLSPQNWRFEQGQAADVAAKCSPRAAYHPNGRCNGKGSQTCGRFDPMQLCFKALENTPESLVITSPNEPDNPIVWCNQVHPPQLNYPPPQPACTQHS